MVFNVKPRGNKRKFLCEENMAHGGTQNAVPPSEQRSSMNNNFCNTCGVTFDSSESLQVHIHNNHNQPVSAAADSSDNQPPTPQSTANGETNQQQQQTLNHYNRHSQEFSNATQLPNYHQPSEMHYPSYSMPNYDQYYHHQHSMEYGLPPPISTHYSLSASQSQSEYKVVPSSNRFHPYGVISNNLPTHHPYASHHSAAIAAAAAAQNQSQNGPAIAAAAAISAAAAQSSMSPSIVTSSSPNQNNLMNSTTVPSSMPQTANTISGQPTPSPSPRQCDKCGAVCETISQLAEHTATAHSVNNNANESTINRNAGNGDIENDIPSFQYSNFVQPKEEPHPADCDILDLDSQKMVYPPHEMNQQGPLPPMHSLHPAMQRPMMWPHGPPPHESNTFLPIPPNHNQNDLKPPMFGSIKNEFSPQIIKQEAAHHLTQLPSTPTNPPQSDISKSFGGSDGSQTSPSEFPSTTTPQDNGPQFRTFEAATSSLPNGGPIMKATSWKSNEARRPKTYNCTACNKWFTSSGHLKRHYNTTLHKNAVKSSGQPDPASLPISAHHHPARDPNSKHHRYNNNKTTHNNNSIVQQQSVQQVQAQPPQQQPTLPNESSRTPDFSSQFTPFAPQSQPTNPMGFQQYQNPMQSNASIHPNAQAGLCGPVSQPRDLLTYSNIGLNTGVHISSNNSHQSLAQDFIQVPQMQQILPESTMQSITSMEHCNIITPITINTSITQSYPLMQRPEDPNYIIGNQMMHTGNSNESTTPPISYYGHDYDEHYEHHGYQHMSDDENKHSKCYSNAIPAIAALRRLNNDIHHADTVPPFSPDIPDKRTMSMSMPYHQRALTPQMGEIVPSHLSPNAPSHHNTADIPKNEASIGNEPSSPSITSTNIGFEPYPIKDTTNGNANPKIRNKSNKRRAAVDTAKLITDTIPAGNDPLRCDPCDKVFNKACYLTQHNKTFHSGEKPFKCQRCGKRFPCDQSHTEHMAKHNGNKPFKCNQCVKQFNHKTDLRRHMCLHTGTKPYICEICNKGFIRKDHMVKHGLTHLKRKNSGYAEPNTPTAIKQRASAKEQLSSDMDEFQPAPKRRKYVLEVDLNAKVIPVKYKQFSIDEMLQRKPSRMNENKENILNDDPMYVE
ncbi:uncharacterized protein LOC129569188 [Sitodiplosis mosellana]|uniref:uncharacterized protein LOC129569188 n=1 Tax=Sitodiplosis mosellana TaxID=263140 RepID=UPI002443C07D|nr:uncharacterized protein LOC129569188 [Sitodiplosis mosellana]